jgi:predicted Zn-dependent protease
MKKLLVQGGILVLSFLLLWLLLRQVDWYSVLRIQKVTDKTEEKLGDLFWEMYQKSETEITQSYATSTVDSIITKICKANSIDRKKLKVHILDKDEINAFALPDGHLVIYSGLILDAENPEELSGVICHEIAHIQLNHVMKKLMKEVGLSALISITLGTGSETIASIAKTLSSTAFDRGLEKDADIKAVDYLIAAKFNPDPFADFLFKLAKNESDAVKYLTWISTHPDSEERAKYILEYSKDKKVNFRPILVEETWQKLKEAVKGNK